MRTITSIILSVVLLLVPAGLVSAQEKEAGNAAQLAMHSVNTQPYAEDDRVIRIAAVLRSYRSPLADYAETFVQEADKHNIDWKLVVSIAGNESTFGKRVPHNSYNAWGWGIPTGASSGIAFSDWKHGIATVSEGLKRKYIDRGLDTPEKMGRIYAASPTWSQKVRFFMKKFDETDVVDNKLIAMHW